MYSGYKITSASILGTVFRSCTVCSSHRPQPRLVLVFAELNGKNAKTGKNFIRPILCFKDLVLLCHSCLLSFFNHVFCNNTCF